MNAISTTIDRRRLLLGTGATAAALATAATMKQPTLAEKANAVWRAAEALRHAMTDLHGVPCKILPGSDADCIVVMLTVAVQS